MSAITLPLRDWHFLTNGAYGHVYGQPNSEWIIKHARNDGTRTYLEWVWLKTLRGERMRGMPHLDFIAEIDGGNYMVGMKRYSKPDYDGFGMQEVRYPLSECEGFPDYLTRLIDQWLSDCPAVLANDLHSGNFMTDGRDLILTDPSSSGYRPVGSINPPMGWRKNWVDDSPIVPTCDRFELVG